MENNQETHSTERMNMDTPEQFIGIFGIQEENIPIFKEELGVEIYAHGGEVTISGDPEKVSLAKLTLEKLNEIGMELQEMEESMAFMDEYAQKFYKMAREDEKSFRREMRRQAQNGEQKK